MASISKLIQALKEFKINNIMDAPLEEHPLMILASELDNDLILGMVANMLVVIEKNIENTIKDLESSQQEDLINENEIQSIAALAAELDISEDEILRKQASVLDEVLNILGSSDFSQAKKAQEEQLNKLRDKYFKQQQDKLNGEIPKEPRVLAAEKVVKKELENKIYRPLEAPGQTRTCPDHPGAQITRIADSVYQCSLDHKIYDYREGYTLMNGTKVPGGSLERQTEFGQLSGFPQMVFDTREGRLQADS